MTKSSTEWICKKNEIISHIRWHFEHYGENPDYMAEYVEGVLKFDIDQALECFRSLVKNLEFFKQERNRYAKTSERVVPKKAAYQKKGKFCASYRSRA